MIFFIWRKNVLFLRYVDSLCFCEIYRHKHCCIMYIYVIITLMFISFEYMFYILYFISYILCFFIILYIIYLYIFLFILYILYFISYIFCTIKMKFGQIVVCCMTNISNIILVLFWRLETSSRPFCDFIQMTI